MIQATNLVNDDLAQTAKQESEDIIRELGGKVDAFLPALKVQIAMRDADAIVNRALVLNALVNISFGAPTEVVFDWLSSIGILHKLSKMERAILLTKYEDLPESVINALSWEIESLWALLWVGALIDELPPHEPLDDRLVLLSPNLQESDDETKYTANMRIRSAEEIYRMLDLYYRAHWSTMDRLMNNKESTNLNRSIIAQRRKALEWTLDRELYWDDLQMPSFEPNKI